MMWRLEKVWKTKRTTETHKYWKAFENGIHNKEWFGWNQNSDSLNKFNQGALLNGNSKILSNKLFALQL